MPPSNVSVVTDMNAFSEDYKVYLDFLVRDNKLVNSRMHDAITPLSEAAQQLAQEAVHLMTSLNQLMISGNMVITNFVTPEPITLRCDIGVNSLGQHLNNVNAFVNAAATQSLGLTASDGANEMMLQNAVSTGSLSELTNVTKMICQVTENNIKNVGALGKEHAPKVKAAIVLVNQVAEFMYSTKPVAYDFSDDIAKLDRPRSHDEALRQINEVITVSDDEAETPKASGSSYEGDSSSSAPSAGSDEDDFVITDFVEDSDYIFKPQ